VDKGIVKRKANGGWFSCDDEAVKEMLDKIEESI
jgi:hypothetical protein